MIDYFSLTFIIAGSIAVGFVLGQRFSVSYRQVYAYRRISEDMIKHLKSQNRSLLRQLADYQNPPEISSFDVDTILNEIGIKLPSWAKPFVNSYLEQFKENPEKLRELIGKFVKTQQGEVNQTTLSFD